MFAFFVRACRVFAGWVKANPERGVPLCVLGVLCLYFVLASGIKILCRSEPHEAPLTQVLPTVRVSTLTPQVRSVMLTLKGLAEPSRLITLRPRTEGYLQDVRCKPGDFVQKGQILAVLTTDQRDLQLAGADAEVKHRALEFEVARSLSKQKYQSHTQLAKAYTALEQSKINQKKAQLDLDYMNIIAPFSGYVGDILVREGVYLNPMDPSTGVLTLAEMEPLHVVSYVTEKDYPFLKKGMDVSLSDGRGHAWTGYVYALSPLSDDQTRSYKLDMRCETPKQDIPQGMTVDVSILKETCHAYALPLSALCLDDEGVLGVKVLSADQTVFFYPVRLISFEPLAVWVDAQGLPQPLPLITVGHGFVNVGQKVASVQDEHA